MLRALGVPDQLARASVRFGLTRFNTEDEVDYAVSKVASVVSRLRASTSSASSGEAEVDLSGSGWQIK